MTRPHSRTRQASWCEGQLVRFTQQVEWRGRDDVPAADKMSAARALTEALEAGWQGFEIAERFSLNRIADAHEWIEYPPRRGRVVIVPD